MQARNFVAKYARLVNREAIHKDRKKAAKRGDLKHKKNPRHGGDSFLRADMKPTFIRSHPAQIEISSNASMEHSESGSLYAVKNGLFSLYSNPDLRLASIR